MDHNDIRHKLSEYMDGAVTPEENAVIEEHLRTCLQCSVALRELEKTVEHMKNIEEVETPAWMTQKIMAKVRAEAEKKGFIHRLFFPLHVKLPLETLGVLLLAVMVFFMYQNNQPAKYAESPTEEFSPKAETSPPITARDELGKTNLSAREKQVPQKPAYKALDMRQEYEKPAPPIPEGRTAPAPTPALSKNEASLERRAASPQATRPTVMQEQAAQLAGAAPQAEAKLKSAAPAGRLMAAGADKDAECLPYEPNIVSLAGIINKKDFPGKPNYESIGSGNERETYWILKLDRPICLSADANNELNQPEFGIAEMQLVLDSAKYDEYRSLLARPVTVRGTLFHAHTGHHHTTVLLKVLDITAGTN